MVAPMIEQTSTCSPILGSAITGAVALVGIYLTNRSNYRRIKLENDIVAKRNHIDLHRERGEELYSSSTQWINAIGGNHLFLISVMQGELTYDQYNDFQIESAKKNTTDFSRIEMIIDVYFQELRPYYDEVIKRRDEALDIQNHYKWRYKDGEIGGSPFLLKFVDISSKFDQASEIFKQQIKQCLRSV